MRKSAGRIWKRSICSFSTWRSTRAQQLADGCEDEETRANLLRMAADIHFLCTHKPATFLQGMQLLLFAHSYVHLKPFTGTIAFGNLDRVMAGLYRADLEAGTLTREEALEIICHFYLSLVPMQKDAQNIVLGASRQGGTPFPPPNGRALASPEDDPEGVPKCPATPEAYPAPPLKRILPSLKRMEIYAGGWMNCCGIADGREAAAA